MSDEKLRAVPSNDLTPLNDTERLVIELADALTNTPADVSDELYTHLRNQFSEEQLMQLAAQIALRIIARAGIDSSTSRATIFIKKRRLPSRRDRMIARSRRSLPISHFVNPANGSSVVDACRWSPAALGPQLTGQNYFESLRAIRSFVLISSTSSSGVRPNSIIIASSSGSGSSKSAN
ncbi:MAG TPA: hypothetical protein VN801_03015 [Candidatus Udaeobacter sp.]|nr:hypothetical protein [Candidatus Udaeobacter sp.]